MEPKLDRQKIQALSSETRTKILKSLNERRKTLSELSKELNLASSTMSGHMELLLKSGLVKKIDDGHKWKYYELTFLGKGIGHPDIKWYVVFGFFGLLMVSGFFWMFDYYSQMPMYFADSLRASTEVTTIKTTEQVFGQETYEFVSFQKPPFPYTALVLAVFGIAGFLITKFRYETKTKKIKARKMKK